MSASQSLRVLRFALAAVAGSAALGPVALAQDVLIRGAEVHTVDERGKLDKTDVLVRGGKVAALGAGLPAPEGVSIIDAAGRPLTPGFFGGLSGIGIEEVPAETATVDSRLALGAPPLQMQWRPEFDVSIAYNPRSTLVPVARIEGLTWTMLAPVPGGSFVAGQGAAVTLDGRQDAILAGSRSLFLDLGGDAVALSGGSRAAQYMLLDQAMREARSRGPAGEHALLRPAGREALARYLGGGRVVFQIDRASDISQAIAFAKRNGIELVIAGAAEAWRVADDLARANVPVIINALENLPNSFDSLGARLDHAALLQRAGVLIAFSMPYDNFETSHNARKVRQLAGNAVAHGLEWDAALAALTVNPARIFGLDASRGRIAVGQSADLVLWSGDPLEVSTAADQVWIAGRAIQMRSRQTELRDRYLERAARGERR